MISVSCHIKPVWDSLEQIINKTESSLENLGSELSDASIMAATELVENAIKYGNSKTMIEFAITADDQIRITVSNTIRAQQDYEEVKYLIDKISRSDDLYALFTERLLDISKTDNKYVRTRLGLIRIAYEGRFEMTYNLKDDFLTITAVNDLKNWKKELTDE
ncbi:MAG: hypothetical protein GY795_35050 [Desulfobacterales bacterium]|nr:hypothetical protein [Desulfobacterales bacterium]